MKTELPVPGPGDLPPTSWTTNPDPDWPENAGGFRGRWFAVLLLITALLAGIAPTLSWLEFASGSENLNAGTVLEMHREGQWLIPTLNGEPRLAKPPLTAWTSAALIPPGSLAALDSPIQAERDAAYARLAFLLRWPSLVLACGLALGTYWLGRVTVSPRFGWSAAVVCASTLLFLRFGRSATTDIQLACWVALANALFASVVFLRASVWKLVLIGIALGLAMLAKGPVAFAQTCAPWILFVLLDPTLRSRIRSRPGFTFGSVVLITALTLAIGVPWFAYILLRNASAMSIWWSEVTREGATLHEPDAWYSYFSIILLVMPWSVFFLAGFGTAVQSRALRAVRLALCLLVVPIVLMSLAKDKNDRYLVPLLPAASIIVAFALQAQFRRFESQNSGDRFLRRTHWAMLAAIMLSIPVLGFVGVLKTDAGTAWYSALQAGMLLLAMAIPLGGMIYWSIRVPGTLVPGTLLCMLVVNGVVVAGFRDAGGRSELKPIADVVRQRAPDASIWFYDPPEHTKIVPADLSIYLNRNVNTARDESTLMKATEDAVLIILQRKGTSEPAVPGWVALDKRGADGRYWWAMKRNPTTHP